MSIGNLFMSISDFLIKLISIGILPVTVYFPVFVVKFIPLKYKLDFLYRIFPEINSPSILSKNGDSTFVSN